MPNTKETVAGVDVAKHGLSVGGAVGASSLLI